MCTLNRYNTKKHFRAKYVWLCVCSTQKFYGCTSSQCTGTHASYASVHANWITAIISIISSMQLANEIKILKWLTIYSYCSRIYVSSTKKIKGSIVALLALNYSCLLLHRSWIGIKNWFSHVTADKSLISLNLVPTNKSVLKYNSIWKFNWWVWHCTAIDYTCIPMYTWIWIIIDSKVHTE